MEEQELIDIIAVAVTSITIPEVELSYDGTVIRGLFKDGNGRDKKLEISTANIGLDFGNVTFINKGYKTNPLKS